MWLSLLLCAGASAMHDGVMLEEVNELTTNDSARSIDRVNER